MRAPSSSTPGAVAAGRLRRSAHRSGAGAEQKREAKRMGRKDGASLFRQAGLHSAASCRFNMPLGSKRVAGISALISSLLLASCGTGGEGEPLRARPWTATGLLIPVVHSCTAMN